jgi:hypothetical protein
MHNRSGFILTMRDVKDGIIGDVQYGFASFILTKRDVNSQVT